MLNQSTVNPTYTITQITQNAMTIVGCIVAKKMTGTSYIMRWDITHMEKTLELVNFILPIVPIIIFKDTYTRKVQIAYLTYCI